MAFNADPGRTTSTFSPDQLIAGNAPVITGTGILLLGENRSRGAVLGRVTLGAATAAAKSGGNTGNGTISAVTLAAFAMAGVYQVRFTAATAFKVTAPDGTQLDTGATGAAYARHLGFTITAGGTPFVAGDGFDITVAAGSGKLKLSAAAATDGSQVPYAILGQDTDASSADQNCPLYLGGEFNTNAMTFGSGNTAAVIGEALRDLGIILRTAQSNAIV